MSKRTNLNIYQMRVYVRDFEQSLPNALSYYNSLFRVGEIYKDDYIAFTQAIMSAYLIDKTILINMEENIKRTW